MYVILVLVDATTKAFLQDAYMEASFTFTIDQADEKAAPEELVTDTMLHARLTQFFENQEALPNLKEKYPALPDFSIGSGKLFSEQVFFEEVTNTDTH